MLEKCLPILPTTHLLLYKLSWWNLMCFLYCFFSLLLSLNNLPLQNYNVLVMCQEHCDNATLACLAVGCWSLVWGGTPCQLLAAYLLGCLPTAETYMYTQEQQLSQCHRKDDYFQTILNILKKIVIQIQHWYLEIRCHPYTVYMCSMSSL